MSDSRPPLSLFLWRPDLGEWQPVGTGDAATMFAAQDAAVAGAQAFGLDAVYRVAVDKPAPLHPSRTISVQLPAPDDADGGVARWSGPGWAVVADSSGVIAVEPPRSISAHTADERTATRAYVLALLAALQLADEGV